MASVRYIHAADLHLDAPFQGLTASTPNGERLGSLLHDSTFAALERLVTLSLLEKPDFVLLAGDIYNSEDYSVRSQLKLRDACERLSEAGIAVFIVHGNHDPLASRLTSITWPDNVSIFPADSPRIVPVLRDGAPLALIHGVSHGSDKETRNLASAFVRDTSLDCFQLGLLHCAVESSGTDRYAPCSLEDLERSGLDAWALGHVHERKTLAEHPFVAYPGNTQGLHVNETGPRGCLLVDAESTADGWIFQARFIPLATVQWQIVQVEVDGLANLQMVNDAILRELEKAREDCDPQIRALVARVILHGRTPLRRELYKSDTQAELLEAASVLEQARPSVWIKDMFLELAEDTPLEELLKREDLLGETVRVYSQLAGDEEEFARFSEQVLGSMFGGRKRRRLTPPSPAEALDLLKQAERLCQDVLEER